VEVAGAWEAVLADEQDVAALRLLTKHYLAVLASRHPGRSVEVRVPPYAAVQCVGGTRHTRGTPPAVVETDALTWVRLARGETAWAEAVGSGRLNASGQRSDLAALLPLE
jgi:hypothetical protein